MIAPDPAALPIRAQILSIQAGVEARLRAPAPDLAPGRAAAPALPWQPGERLQAQVQAALPGGRFLVRIAEFEFDMQLPPRARVGDQLQLAYAGSTPRPQFVLAQDEPPAGGAPRLDLSREGRALAAALATRATPPPDAAAARRAPALIASPAPLLQPATDATTALAVALRAALDLSGLFYESHLAEWVEGRRPLESLSREPQAGLRAGSEAAPARPERAPVAAEPADQAPARAAATPLASTANAPSEPEQPLIHPQALPLVHDQLQTLENGQLLWSGQAWPGQPLEWRLHALDEDGAQAGEEPVPWATQLRLSLPRLGAIVADLQITGSSLRLSLAAADPLAGAELESARAALAGALSDAGLKLVHFATVAGDGVVRDGVVPDGLVPVVPDKVVPDGVGPDG
jgi:hypothetical protein